MKSFLAILTTLLCLGAAGLHAENRELPLKAGDKIAIQLAGISPEDAQAVNHQYTIGEDGKIGLLHIDAVTAAGEKASALAHKIEGMYKAAEIYLHPVVTVNVDTNDAPRLVYVEGEVSHPNGYAYRPGLTVMKAITVAGGAGAFAHLSHVKLKRNGKVIKELDLSKTSNPDGDTAVEPEDEVIVPNR